MSGTVKTVLIVGGVAVGVVVLVRLLSPAPTVPTRPKSGTDLLSVSNLVQAGSFLGGLFSGGRGDGVPEGAVVNTQVQESEITDAQAAAFASGHFGVDYSQL